MPLNFTAIDFETANSARESACSVGLVKVHNGVVVDRAGWLIRPQAGFDEFLEWNTRIHGITAADVTDAPSWAQQFPDLVAFADGDHLVAHNASFDMSVIRASCTAASVLCPDLAYVCSLQVARKTYELDSYRLPVAAMAAGFEDFAHHDALADAEACAAIMVHAAKRHGAATVIELARATGIGINSLMPPKKQAVSAVS